MNPSSVSKHLNSRQVETINRIGNVLVPGSQKFDSFSKTGCSRNLDRALDYTPTNDLNDLKLLLTLLSFFPNFGIRLFIWLLEKSSMIPSFLGGSLLRLVHIALKGLILSLYFGDQAVLEKMEYSVSVYQADMGAEQKTSP